MKRMCTICGMRTEDWEIVGGVVRCWTCGKKARGEEFQPVDILDHPECYDAFMEQERGKVFRAKLQKLLGRCPDHGCGRRERGNG